MKPSTAANLLRLYPAGWRKRYGREFAALLEDHPLSLRTILDVVWRALETRMDLFRLRERQPAALTGQVWAAWMTAITAGLILYGTVDDSPFARATQRDALLNASWTGIEIGSVLAAAAIAIGGAPVAWSMLRNALRGGRRHSLYLIAVPAVTILILIAWVSAVLLLTRGTWGPSPWAIAIARPDLPSETFRWMTGSISALLLLLALGSSALGIARAVPRSEFPALQLAILGAPVRIQPIALASRLAPWAAVGMLVMTIGVIIWGIAAMRMAGDPLHQPLGPLGMSAATSWLISSILFAAASACSGRLAWCLRTESRNSE